MEEVNDTNRLEFIKVGVEVVPTEEVEKKEAVKKGLYAILDQELINELEDSSQIKQKYDSIESLQGYTEVKAFLESDFTLEAIEALLTFTSSFDLKSTRNFGQGSLSSLLQQLKEIESANTPFFSTEEIDFV